MEYKMAQTWNDNGTDMGYKMEQKWTTKWNRHRIQKGTEIKYNME